jgi:hypothetical protein
MSRRRKPSRRRTPGERTLRVVCSHSSSGPHALYRIATVRLPRDPGPEDMPTVVRVEYVHNDDLRRAAESDSVRNVDDGAHRTRWFACGYDDNGRACGRLNAIIDEKLAHAVVGFSTLSRAEVELSDLVDACSRVTKQ